MIIIGSLQHIAYIWKVLFVSIIIIWGYYIITNNLSKAERVANLFILLGLLGTFSGILKALTGPMGAGGTDMVDKFIDAVGLSIGTSLIGIVLFFQCEIFTILFFQLKKTKEAEIEYERMEEENEIMVSEAEWKDGKYHDEYKEEESE